MLLAIFFIFLLSFGHAEEEGSHDDAHPRAQESISLSSYLNLDPLVIPIIKQDRIVGYLRILVVIDCGDKDKREEVKNKLDIYRDAFFSDLYATLSALWDPQTPLTDESVKFRLQRICDRLMPEGNLLVIIKNFFLQRVDDFK